MTVKLFFFACTLALTFWMFIFWSTAILIKEPAVTKLLHLNK